MTLELATSGRKDVLKREAQRDRKDCHRRRTLYLDNSCCDLNKGHPRFPERVQDYGKRGAEGPDHPYDHPGWDTKKNVRGQFEHATYRSRINLSTCLTILQRHRRLKRRTREAG